jgi:uncharacterized protein YkwD
LAADARLATPSQDLASDMAAHHFLSHVSSDGRTTRDRIVASAYTAGATAWTALENVDFGSGAYGTPLATAFGWLNSSEHREHMLDPAMRSVGGGIAEGAMTPDGSRGVFYVADFGVRSTATSAPPPTSKHRRACKSRTRVNHRTRHRARRIHHRRRCS